MDSSASARVELEHELHLSRARWRAVVDSAVDGIVVIDASGRIEGFNPAAERIFGYAEHEVVGRNVNVLMPSPYHEEHDGYLARYLRDGDARVIGRGRDVIGKRKDGTTFPVHLSVGEMSLEGERKFTGILHDLSARVALEEQLRASEARWRAVIESAVDGIVVIDASGRIESFNRGATRLFGYEESEVLGANVNLLMPSPYREEHDGYLARYLREGQARVIGIGREVTGRKKDGSTFPLHLSVGEMTVEGDRKFTGILHDLSSRVRLEEQLREQAALARIGEMAAVIAHEVKNPLAGIRGAIQVIGGRLPPDSPDAAITREIVSRIDELSEQMKELLLFSRPPQPHPSLVDLAGLAMMTATLYGADPSASRVSVDVQGDSPLIHADAALLKIVLVNLLLNATQAMKGQGTIQVTIATAGMEAVVSVSDAGPGIPPEVREKIFTPFFTTKSRGTGLGLAIARRLVEAHRGTISVDCPAQGGTLVRVALPFRS
jgi:PAS domain S-box-containing protein